VCGWVGLAGHGGTAQALSCPSALGAACGVIDPAIGTVCYSPLPQVPTIEFITIQSSGRLLNCPDI
jgi:hypothetical protein